MQAKTPSQAVAKALMTMAALQSKALTEDAADMLINDLSAFPAEAVLEALKRCRLELRHFPTVADIIQRIPGTQENAQELIGKIFEAIDLCGYSSPEKAQKHIGETGWRAVQYFGGWQRVCDFPASQIGTLKAQLREATQNSIETAKATTFIERSLPPSDRKLEIVNESSEEALTPEQVNKELQKIREECERLSTDNPNGLDFSALFPKEPA